MDPTSLEKWYSKNCELKIESFLDDKSFAEMHLLSNSTVNVDFVDGTERKIKLYGDYWYAADQPAFKSQQWTEALISLEKIPKVSQP